MGRVRRPTPARLPEKLLLIRESLGLSQNGMLRKLGIEGEYDRATISGFERGVREPPLPVLLEYARAANIYVEVLIDDGLDLPEKLPARERSEGVKQSSA
jgi:transcriptional regulator with XRE-family HTH domain